MTVKTYYSLMRIFCFLVLLVIVITSCGPDKEAGIPLPEHPRPDFHRDAWINLNEQWDFALDPDETGEVEGWHNDTAVFDRKITVPFSWAAPLSGIEVRDVHIGWYARNLEIPGDKEWNNKRVFIVIGACDFGTKVWLNGEFVGEHEGGYTPFEFDLTDFIDRNNVNRLVIRVEDKPVRGRQIGKQGYGPVKGIWQTVYLEGRSDTHIRLAHFSPDIDNKKVSVRIELSEATESDLGLSAYFKDKSVEAVRQEIRAGQKDIEFDIPIPDQRLWTLDDPYLYDVDVCLSRGSEEEDRVHTYFGMRKIGTGRLLDSKDMYVTLNNKPIYLNMALDQSYHPEGYYTFPSDEFIKEEIQRAKAIGLNGLRIHIKTEVPRKLYWADKLGVLIRADIPHFRAHNERGIPSGYARKHWEYTFRNQVARDYNHPSIFNWVLFNETWGIESRDRTLQGYHPETREWVRSLYYWAKELDPTRLVDDNSPNKFDHIISDINSWHGYLPALKYAPYLDNAVANTFPGSEWNYIGGNKQTDIPLLNTECGAVWGYAGSAREIDISYEYHQMINTFRKYQKNSGFVFTEFHDVINEWNGYYRYDRSLKDWGLDELCPGMTINDFHSEMYLITGDDFNTIVKPGSVFSIPVTASFMTDRVPSEMTVKTILHGWNRYGEHKEYSTGQFTIKPRPYKVFDVSPVKVTAPDEEGLLVFCTYLIDERGQTVQRNFIPFRVLMDESTREETLGGKTEIIRLEPDDYSRSEWSVKQVAVMDGLKVWGTGTGFFEYEFPLPKGFNADTVEEVEFLIEVSARYIQGKDMQEEFTTEGSEYYRGKDYNPRNDPGAGKMHYLMTDDKKHTSTVSVILNGMDAQTVFLGDDPADHRGLLSWMNQIRPQNIEWKRGQRNTWELDEAGSYGYLVKKTFSREGIEKAAEEKVFRVKLAVNESSDTSGGLAVYGEKFGRYLLGPTIIIRMK